MKVKTEQRIGGACLFGASMGIGSLYTHVLANANYDLISIFSSELPLDYKITGAGILTLSGISLPLLSLAAVDGITDIAKGTHHYFLSRLWQKLAKNEETKNKIEQDLAYQMSKLEQEV